MVFTCQSCTAVSELLTDRGAQLTVVRHDAACPTLATPRDRRAGRAGGPVKRPWLAAVVVVAAFAAPTAHADTVDDHYLTTLAQHGVTADAGALIAAAHDTCDAMAQGYVGSGFAIWKATSDYMGQGLSKQQADQAEFVAIDNYCPNYGHW